ncbi:MAG: LegC family aminotransferase [Bacteroidales bacterium]|nr:LegC family aminotransferase [Bacteroidales bacterium]
MFDKIAAYIRELYNSQDFIPLSAPVFTGNEKKYLEECIDSTFVSSVGKFVDQFEEMVANYTGAQKAVVCVNGTNALHLALMLAGVKRNDEVITQALTFVATCNAISYIGAHPIFIDVDRDTMGLSPTAVDRWLNANAELHGEECFNKNTGHRIKCCVPMHTFGHPVHLDELMKVCNKWHLELVEDAAESLGSFYKGKHTGTFGRIGIISFNGNKTITTGGGGMLLFNDEELATRAKHLTTQAKRPHKWEFYHDEVGYNYRMPNINAALGCAQMENLEQFVLNKRETASSYAAFFKDIEGLEFFTEPAGCRSNYWLNALIMKDRETRDSFLQYTNNNGIMTRPIWELMNRLPMFRNCQTDGLKNTEWLADRVVNIPSSVNIHSLSKNQIK